MPHQRLLIRQAVRDLLVDETDAGKRVSTNRQSPYRTKDLPAISVYTGQEIVQDEPRMASGELNRELDLEVVAFVTADASADDALDRMAEQIEAAIAADPYLGDRAAEVRFNGTSAPEILEEGETPLGLIALLYTVTYQTEPAEPTDGVDDFLKADITINQGEGVDANDAHDLVVVQEAS